MSIGEAEIKAAAQLLRQGKLVAFPTETVYGLGADATNERAVAAVYAAKGRPKFNPLSPTPRASNRRLRLASSTRMR
jgi:L-threonylcarbamoyladenylate synthase